MKRLVTALGVAACIAVTVTGCKPGDDIALPTKSPSVTVTSPGMVTTSGAPASPVVNSTSPSNAGTPATAGGGKCLDLMSPVVTRAVGNIDTYYGRDLVAVRGTSAKLGNCPKLMWVEAELRGGTASSPEQVLFFDTDGFLRTDTDRNTAFTSVASWTDSSVSVNYRWLNSRDANANPTGGPVTVTYTLNGKTITADKDVPSQSLADGPKPTQSTTTQSRTTQSTTPTPAVTSTPAATTTAVSHCDSATAEMLHGVANMQYGSQLVQPFTLGNIKCDGDWAIGATVSSAAQPARVAFHYTGGGWSAVALGTGSICSGTGMPASTASAFGC
ncbi:LppP/LprE family lipoprotein [Gordonia sp. CPCC 205333]|uniref:LppP/LprE family lipoprotein n=1 Tax=Gordonia sp. CPCC 205333 TaxID=3140790 RepID=UPI003AF341A5